MASAKRQRVDSGERDGDGDGSGGGEPATTLRFRNYVPVDPELRKLVLPPPQVPSVVLTDHVRSTWESEEERAKGQPLNIAPRKPNFDLKRDVARKMQRLNIRTQLAIADLIRERLSLTNADDAGAEGGNGGGGDEGGRQLAAAVMAAGTDRDGADSDLD